MTPNSAHRVIRPRTLIRRLRNRTALKAEAYAGLRHVKQFCDTAESNLRICWDLDNTLIDSGSLLRTGMSLDQAIAEAQPVTNMLEFYARIRALVPDAAEFVLSARASYMRRATMAWCERYGLAVGRDRSVCLVPSAASKLRIWRTLAEGARLMIVDDLSFNHEDEEPSLYHELVREAQTIASSYVGYREIGQIAADRDAIESIAARAVAALHGSV